MAPLVTYRIIRTVRTAIKPVARRRRLEGMVGCSGVALEACRRRAARHSASSWRACSSRVTPMDVLARLVDRSTGDVMHYRVIYIIVRTAVYTSRRAMRVVAEDMYHTTFSGTRSNPGTINVTSVQKSCCANLSLTRRHSAARMQDGPGLKCSSSFPSKAACGTAAARG